MPAKPSRPLLDDDSQFDTLLDWLKRARGFDFSGYKRPGLLRRIRKRMEALPVETFGGYADYLEVHPEEFTHLFNAVLINVTAFFRDAPAWEYLAKEIIPRIIDNKRRGEPIRIWSAGCASGAECYTLAILFAEALGIERFREQVKIYGTDVDEEELSLARQATYAPPEVSGVPPALLANYFDEQGGRYTFNRELRRVVILGRHDLLQDAPISRIDLLACRNALMYFNAEAQRRILARLNFALNDSGYLFLGKAEMLFAHPNLFRPVDMKHRVFAKVSASDPRERLMVMAEVGSEEATTALNQQMHVHDLVFDLGPVAQVVVDRNGFLAMANERARLLFRLTPEDIGRPVQDLEISYRPVELRSCIEQACKQRGPVVVSDVEWRVGVGDVLSLDVQTLSLPDNGGEPVGVVVTFTDVTVQKRLQRELEDSNRELETAYEELQSTNEELETTNEELQSTNEELETVNDELRQSGEKLHQVNSFLKSILASLDSGVVVLDRDLRVAVWNHKAEDLWGLRFDETDGARFLNLDIGLPVRDLRQIVRAGLTEKVSHEMTLTATNRRGRAISCQVTCTPLMDGEKGNLGVILLMQETDGAATEAGQP